MEEIAQRIGDFFLALALALSLIALGVCVLATVISGLAMALGSGKVMEIAKDWFWRIAMCLVFTSSSTLIINGLRTKLAGG